MTHDDDEAGTFSRSSTTAEPTGRPAELSQPTWFEVDDFSSYTLVIDARTPREFAADHVPGAINLPVVSDAEFAEVGTLHAVNPHSAYLVGARYALHNIATHLEARISRYGRDARFLVYCFRGGKRSKVWADMLRNIGYRTDVVKGGWKAYRSWVRAGLESAPAKYRYRVISGLTGCGKTLLLQELKAQGEQVLDLEDLAAHRGSLIGALPDRSQPTQKMFDSNLFSLLRSFDIRRTVWVEAESKKIGRLQIPQSIYEAIQTSPLVEVTSPMEARIRVLRQTYPNYVLDPESMVRQLAPLKPLIGNEELQCWQQLAKTHQVDKLFERVLVAHYDPSYVRSSRKGSRPYSSEHLRLDPTDTNQLRDAASSLTSASNT
ncbi:tRNA 2-selenouridine(34) synthase MnmH [Aquincola tertiaricarbonis]|uniref:tRNA 2-selenouridine(34) synthase MnmH n=1 Tax=Aquincola tertiaricarbonis TaxID=391953 RepID=UPI0009FADCBD|nr:tRNA 2-selenouridine(34) synthase MnmH [Aquincola tertiaricarbonis]